MTVASVIYFKGVTVFAFLMLFNQLISVTVSVETKLVIDSQNIYTNQPIHKAFNLVVLFLSTVLIIFPINALKIIFTRKIMMV